MGRDECGIGLGLFRRLKEFARYRRRRSDDDGYGRSLGIQPNAVHTKFFTKNADV